jgi:ERCC4-type nuclease
VFDDREPKDIQNLFDDAKCKNKPDLKIRVKRILNGDYGFFHKDKLIFVVERKTWPDFSSSIQDGRIISQLANMKHIHDTDPSVHIFIILEGKASRSRYQLKPDDMEKKITSIMFKHKHIRFIYTQSKRKTVAKIIELVNFAPVDHCQENEMGQNLLEVKVKQNIPAKCLMKIKGIGNIAADKLLKYHTPRDIFALSEIQLTDLKIHKAKALVKILDSNAIAPFLEGISGISKVAAKNIVQSMEEFKIPVNEWSIINLSYARKSPTKILGTKLASKIINILDKKE